MEPFDPVTHLRAAVDEFLTLLRAPPPGVNLQGLAGHASGAIFGAAQALTAAGIATHAELQAELDRFTQALVDGGFAQRVTASMSSSHSMTAIRAGETPPARPPDPGPGPAALQQVIALNRTLKAETGRTLWATSVEQWSDGLLLHWALVPAPNDVEDPLVRSLLSAASWNARDDLGFEHTSKTVAGGSGTSRLSGFVAFRGAPAPGAHAVTISLREDRGEHPPRSGDELFVLDVPLG